MELSYDDRRQLSLLAAQEDPHAVAAALAGKQSAFEAVSANPELLAVFAPFMDREERVVVLKDTAGEGSGCRVALTLFKERLALIKEVISPSAFKTELLLHDRANRRVTTERLGHSMRHQFLVTELGPRQDMLREIRRLVESDASPPAIAIYLVDRLHEVVHCLNTMAQDGHSHVDVKWENISRVPREQGADEEGLAVALIDMASCLTHNGRLARVDPNKVAATANHAPPELLQGELHPTNDMHAVGHMLQSLIFGLGTSMRLGLPTLHLDEALLSALSSGEPLETAWTRRCGLRPNVIYPTAAHLHLTFCEAWWPLLLQAVLVAPPSRQPSWDFVQHQTKRLKFWARKLEEPGQDQRHILAAMELEMQLLLQLSSATKDASGAPTGPKACLPRSVLEAARRRYAAVHERYTSLQELREFMRANWKMELPDPIPPKKTILDDPDLPLIDASDEKAIDAHFDPLPPPYALTSEEYYERREEALALTMDSLCPDGFDMTVFLRILDHDASEDSVLERLSIAQQCIDRWNGFDIEYFKEYALPFLPASSAASSAGSAASSAGSAASSAAASTRPMDALTHGMRMLTIDATHRGGHALRAAARRKEAAAPAGLPAQQGAAQQRGGQEQQQGRQQQGRQRQRQRTAAAEEQEGGAHEEAAENSSKSSAEAMPPPPARASGRRGAARPAAREQAAAAEAAGTAASVQAQEDPPAGGNAPPAERPAMRQALSETTNLPAAAPCPVVKLLQQGLGTRGRTNTSKAQCPSLWLCSHPAQPGFLAELPRALAVHESWDIEAAVLGREVVRRFDHLRQGGSIAAEVGSMHYLYLPLAECATWLPAAQLKRWQDAGLLSARRRDGPVLVFDPLQFPLIIQVTVCTKGLSKKYCGLPLRDMLSQYGVREAAGPDDAGCGVAATSGGGTFVFTELGACLWHDLLRTVLASSEAAIQLKMHYSPSKPSVLGASTAWTQHAELMPS